MNQPTREEFEQLKERQDDFDKRLTTVEGRQTEPIKIDHLEIDRGGTQELLKETNKKLEIIIQTQADRSEKLETLEHGQKEISRKQDEQFEYIKKEFASIEERQKRQDDVLFTHSKHINAFQEEMKGLATKEDLKTMKEEILDAVRKISHPGGNGHSES